MSTHNIPLSKIKTVHPKLSQFCSYGIFSKGLKNEFKTATGDKPSVFEPLKVYCSMFFDKRGVSIARDISFTDTKI